MELRKALRLGDSPCLALVGAGGKTSLLFRLASEFNPPVILSASTHLSKTQVIPRGLTKFDRHHIINKFEDLQSVEPQLKQGTHLLTGPFEGDRARGLDMRCLSWLDHFTSVNQIPFLMEADGSRTRPIKAPADHEPAIPNFVRQVAVVVGLSGLGKPLESEWVHRPEIFADLSGGDSGRPISMETIRRYLVHPMGGLKNIPLDTRRICILNQADTKDLVDAASDIYPFLLDAYDSVVVSSLNPGDDFLSRSTGGDFQGSCGVLAVHAAYEPVAGIVLAAGEGKRYGQPKQLLTWKGKPLVWHSVNTAIQAGLKPVLVVTGAYHQEVEQAVGEQGVVILHNPSWDVGQGTSVSAGVAALYGSIGAAIFFLADQPHIPVELIDQLVRTHALSHAPVIVPWVENQQANPVLFDKDLFPELGKLDGEMGGRVIIAKADPLKLLWKDPSILFDVDTPDDYNELLRMVD